MFVFEGKCRLITPGQTVRFMFHIDHQAGQLRIQIDELEPYSKSFAQWAELFKDFFPFPAPRGLLSALAEAQPGQATGAVAVLANLAGIGPGLQGKLDLRTDALGVSSILQSKSCEKADFSPQGKTVVDLHDTDFSGVRFVDTDFSSAILLGVNFSGCRFERCTFARGQLSGRQLTGADFSNQELQNLDLSGAKLDRAKLDGAGISRCNLRGASLRNASISRTRFMSSNLTLTAFDGTTGTLPMFVDCDLTFASLRGVVLAKPVFSASQLVSVEAKGASLADARFGCLTLEDAVERVVLKTSVGANPIDTPATIHQADFSGTTLNNARFDGARITESKFDAAKMQKAILGGTTLITVSFKDTELSGADFGARKVEYVGAHRMREPVPVATFQNVDFDNANLHATNFCGALLTGKIRHARQPRRDTSKTERMCLAGATFRSGLLGVDWSYVDAGSATITLDLPAGVEIKDFKARQAILPVVEFAGLRLPGADFSYAELREMHFGDCDLADAKFGRAVLESADFTGANLQGADFSHASLLAANFSDAWMWEATLDGAVLTEANFSSAMLAQVNFHGISDGRLSAVTFSGACLVSASFKNIKAPRSGNKQTTFSSACMAGADFSGAALTDVVLTKAQLSARKGTIAISHPVRSGDLELEYEATKLESGSTGQQTICPDGKSGACTLERLRAHAVPATWSRAK
ncbi:pentapeptide repeat-containing protein [Dyella sp. 2RAB6]|uniref:pentapeptide repeat-containing protein n=1 Tax=Dyella sp. 2RAB6 TaxID=3232992 RepID=UPI003F8E8A2C